MPFVSWAVVVVCGATLVARGGWGEKDLFELPEPRLVQLAHEELPHFQVEQLVIIRAELVEEADFEKVYVVRRIASIALAGGCPSAALAKRLVATCMQTFWRSSKADAKASLAGQHAFGGADLPLEVTAQVVRDALAVQREDVLARLDAFSAV